MLSGTYNRGDPSSITDKNKKKFKRTCRQICTTGWAQMRLRTQIISKLVLIIFLLFAIYMVVLVIIFEFYYKPDVLGHFKEELEQVHEYRTSNMTVSISSRFEAFDSLTRDNLGKIQELLSTTYAPDFDSSKDLPYTFKKEKYKENCSVGVSEND